MAKVIKVGPTVNSGENSLIQYLDNKCNLPDTFLVLTNVQVVDQQQSAEVDAIVFGTPGIYTLEIKDWAGKISGDNRSRQWRHNGRAEDNPCFQARQNNRILRSFIRHQSAQAFSDVRIFNGITMSALLVLVHPNADTSAVRAEEEDHLRICLKLDDLGPTLLKDQALSKRFITPSEIRKLAVLLGAAKEEIDAWCIHCHEKGNRAGAKFCRVCGKSLVST